MCALLLTHPRAHTPGTVDSHTHTWSSGHTHSHKPGAVDTYTPGAVDTHLEQRTHTHTPHTPGAVGTHTHLEQWAHTHTHTHTHLEQWAHTHTHTWSSGNTHTHTHTHTHTWSSGQSTLRRPGGSWGFSALLKGLTSVVDNSCRSREPTTSDYKPSALSIRTATSILTYSYTVLLHIQCGSVKSNVILIKIHKHIKSYSIASEIPSNVRFFSEI